MKKRKNNFYKNNNRFIDSAIINDRTYTHYLNVFRKLCLSMFEWVDLPDSMNAQWLEKCLFRNGQATLLKDENYGFINTNCCSNGKINIYGLPTSLNCYSFEFHTTRKLYTGLVDSKAEFDEAILVQNDWDCIPTLASMELFSFRLYQAERVCDINILAQKTPLIITINDTQKLLAENLYNKYDGNQPFIIGDKKQFGEDLLKVLKTDAPYVADKIMEYKKEIWNEALTFLGINNLLVDKKERLISDEANSNNELINLNLQSFFAPRKLACEQFNKKFDTNISVRLRSDLHNTIKQLESMVIDYNQNNKNINEMEVDSDVKLYNRT